jgi:hypothetical protein
VVIVSLILLSELSARTAGGAIAGLRAARRHPLDDRHLGNIADILYRRGDYDEATAPQTKRLRANEDLGDLDGLKAAKWEAARIDLAQKKYNRLRINKDYLHIKHVRTSATCQRSSRLLYGE